jgi:hypothetical protein
VPKTHKRKVFRADNGLDRSCSPQWMAIVKSFQGRKIRISILGCLVINLYSDLTILPDLVSLACKCDSHIHLHV